MACLPVPVAEATAFGVMHVDADDKIIDFVEKPANPPTMPGDDTKSLASMRIYVFDADYLYELLKKTTKTNTPATTSVKTSFRKLPKLAWPMHILSAVLRAVRSNAEPYWRDVGTLEAYWKASLDLASVTPELDMYDQNGPIRTPYGIPAASEIRSGPLRQPRHDAELAGLWRVHYLRLGGGAVGAVPARAYKLIL